MAQGRTDTAQLTASSRAVTCTFRYGERKLTVYSLNLNVSNNYSFIYKIIRLFVSFPSSSSTAQEYLNQSHPQVCQAQIIWSSTCTAGLGVSCTHCCNVQGSITQSQAQFRFSSSSATRIINYHSSRYEGTS